MRRGFGIAGSDCSVSELVLLASAEATKFPVVRHKVATDRLKDENKAARRLGRADDFINGLI